MLKFGRLKHRMSISHIGMAHRSYGRALPSFVCVLSMINPATRSDIPSKTRLAMKIIPTTVADMA